MSHTIPTILKLYSVLVIIPFFDIFFNVTAFCRDKKSLIRKMVRKSCVIVHFTAQNSLEFIVRHFEWNNERRISFYLGIILSMSNQLINGHFKISSVKRSSGWQIILFIELPFRTEIDRQTISSELVPNDIFMHLSEFYESV